MPLHDWTKVAAGIYHHFHNAWITELSNSLNDGLLPEDFYALGEQRTGDIGPDVLTLHNDPLSPANPDVNASPLWDGSDAVAVAVQPPRVSVMQESGEDLMFYLKKQRSISIRHVSGDDVVAFIEIVSPANKHAVNALGDLTDKVVAARRDRIHVMVIDPFPGSEKDPQGIHDVIWRQMMLAGKYQAPEGKTRTLASYACGSTIKAYVEPIAIGTTLIDMPLFLSSEAYVPVPLEETYLRAWNGVPKRWQRVIAN